MALKNPALREASYTLPDGTIVIDPKKEKSPTLAAALQNPYLKSASYTLPDGTIIIDPRKPASPNLSKALQNSALRDATFALPEGIQDPNIPISPDLAKVRYGLSQLFMSIYYDFEISLIFISIASLCRSVLIPFFFAKCTIIIKEYYCYSFLGFTVHWTNTARFN